jgi:hypothetical protein
MKKRKAKRARKKPHTAEQWLKQYITDLARLRTLETEAEFKEGIKQKSKELPKDPPSQLFFAANSRLRELHQLANEGDWEAASYLLPVLTKNVEDFLNLCLQKPTLVRQIWYPGQSWPLLHTQLNRKRPKEGLTVPKDHVLRKIGVIPGRRTSSKEAVATRVAIELHVEMEYHRRMAPQEQGGERYTARDAAHAEQIKRIRALGPLQPSNWHECWKEAERIFDKRYGPQFQDHPDFRNWRVKAYQGKQTKKGKPRKTAGAKRRDIKNAIKGAFRSLANMLKIAVPEPPSQ